jgi:hypothetical protein
MSHKPDAERTLPQDPTSSEPPPFLHPFLLADYNMVEPVEVELVAYPVTAEEPQFEALLADGQCEV